MMFLGAVCGVLSVIATIICSLEQVFDGIRVIIINKFSITGVLDR